MRNAFIKTIIKIAQKDDKVVLLTGDLGFKIFDVFQAKFPDRFYNVGIAEQNMASMAAGMAKRDLKPFVYSIAPFATLRCAEQIRNDLCYNNANVIIVGAGGGYTYGHNGPTHHSIEDIAMLRAMPNMKIACPGDPIETEACIKYLWSKNGPGYLRIGRAGEQKVWVKKIKNIKSPLEVFWGGRGSLHNVDLFCTGNVLPLAKELAETLSTNYACTLFSVPLVKPIDKKFIKYRCLYADYTFIIEEHNVHGGLGAAICEIAAEDNGGGRVFRFGIDDCFAKESGDREHLRSAAGLTAPDMFNKINKIIERCEHEYVERWPR